ncbi:glycogen synthase GlgA [Nitratifractor sp.]
MYDSLKILFTASEAVPYAKTGGLADVAGALPRALKAMGHDVIVVIPRYYSIDRSKLQEVPGPLGVPMGPMRTLWAGVWKDTLPESDVPIYFIDYEASFGRSGLYSDENGYSWPDNDKRFTFLSKAAFELARMLDFRPDIIHSHDWHTAPQPLLRDSRYLWDRHFADSATVLTIHNLQHQGIFHESIIDPLEVGWEHFNPHELESMGAVNFLKGGIAVADRITTVSPTYALEIQTPDFGFGLEGHIRAHADRLRGILNGVDYREWSPAVDPLIPARYDRGEMEGKAICKRELQKRFGLPDREDLPLVGFVGRFAEQKGIGLIAGAMERLLHSGAQFVFLGTGEQWAEGFFSDVAARAPQTFACHIGYSNELAHWIEAGSDFFLMPSLFEPCGLNQIYSLRYGTLPIVRATGGLDDTIDNYDPKRGTGNGFKFWEASPEALANTLQWAIATWRESPDAIAAMRDRAMSERFDWERAAREYTEVYREAIAHRKGKA